MKNTEELKEIDMEQMMQDHIITIQTIAMRGMTILPHTLIHFDLSRAKSIRSVEESMMDHQKLFLVTQKDSNIEEPDYDQVYHIGTLAEIKQIIKMPNNIVRVMVEGICRGRLLSFTGTQDYLEGVVEEISEPEELRGTVREEAMVRQMKELVTGFAVYYPKTGASLERYIRDISDLGLLVDQITINMPLNV